MITKALQKDLRIVYGIVQDTIAEIYPHYYPSGAVRFFQNHHNAMNIEKDIADGNVYLLHQDHVPVGTVTINGNEINRLFVLPEFQGMGFGTQLMTFAEHIISEHFPDAVLSSSFSAQEMYAGRGYVPDGFRKIACDNGDWLCYNLMRKKL